ncbi:MoaD/ThiS family protein [Candidatus Thorarchaeota archaeon]|nr:MAG: MoaD/ThiS family protein [Candidatus Thorarchaeota archaeon]
MVKNVLISFKAFGPMRRLLQKGMLELKMSEGSTVRDVIDDVLLIGGEELAKLVLHQGEVSGNLIVLLNRRDVRTLENELDTEVTDGDQLTLLPHVQGG